MVKVQGHGQSISRSEAEFHNNAGDGKTLRAKQNRDGSPRFFEATKKKIDSLEKNKTSKQVL